MILPLLAGRIFNVPLAIHPDKAEVILSAVILPKLRGDVVPEALAPLERPAPAVRPAGGSSIAVVPVEGMLVRRTGGMDAASGLQSYDALSTTLGELAADPSVDGIVLAMNSPGGEVTGLADAAALIRAVAKAKPVFAVADHQMASAAYWLASAADRVFVTEDSVVGSIGILAMHVDQSARDAQQGLAYTPIFAGSQKLVANAHLPLSDEGRATLQAVVDRAYGRFTAAVAKYRDMPVADVRATEAAVYLGRDAIDAKLADEAGGVDQAVAAMARHLKQSRNVQATPARQPARGPRAHVITRTTMTAQHQAGGDPVENEETDLPREGDTNDPNPEPGESPPGDRPQQPPRPVVPETGGDTASVDLASIRAEAATGALAHAVRMIRLCAKAGMPALAAEFLEKGVTVEAAGERLVARMAEAQAQTAITTAHAAVPSAAATVRTPNVADIYRRRNAPAGAA